jgi:hypothetical protein
MVKTPRRDDKSRKKAGSGKRAYTPAVEQPPVKKDDPARDKTEMEGSVLQPLPHAD